MQVESILEKYGLVAFLLVCALTFLGRAWIRLEKKVDDTDAFCRKELTGLSVRSTEALNENAAALDRLEEAVRALPCKAVCHPAAAHPQPHPQEGNRPC